MDIISDPDVAWESDVFARVLLLGVLRIQNVHVHDKFCVLPRSEPRSSDSRAHVGSTSSGPDSAYAPFPFVLGLLIVSLLLACDARNPPPTTTN